MAQPTDPAADAAKVAIDIHGYAFQEAVLRQCQALRDRCGFEFEVAEFPVELRGLETRVDFVLRWRQCLIVVECKRANPKMSTWVFAQSHYRSQLASGREINVDEVVKKRPGEAHALRRVQLQAYGMEQYQYGFEVKDKTKLGDEHEKSRSRGAIEDAVTQVLRGAGGLMEAIPRASLHGGYAMVIPAIVTTATLQAVDTDLSKADLSTGNIGDVTLTKKPCLWYEHPRSVSLKPKLILDRSNEEFSSLSGKMRASHSRSVAVVNALELDRFLRHASHLALPKTTCEMLPACWHPHHPAQRSRGRSRSRVPKRLSSLARRAIHPARLLTTARSGPAQALEPYRR